MEKFNLNQNDSFSGMTLKGLQEFISSCSKEDIAKIFADAKRESKNIEFDESKQQLRLTDEILKRPFEIVE